MDSIDKIHTCNIAVGECDFDSATTGTRKLKTALIMICTVGAADIEIDSTIHTIRSGSLLIAMPESNFGVVQGSCNARYVIVAASLFWEAATPINPLLFGEIKSLPCREMSDELRLAATRFFDALASCHADITNPFRTAIARNIVQSFMMDFAAIHGGEINATANCSRPEALFKDFVRLVADHCASQREVDFYADKMCITPRYLSWVVRTVSGSTPKVLIDKRAIMEIKSILKNTKKSAQEIAYEMGFPNQSFFSRYFKKNTGLTPMQFRSE